MVAVGPTGGTIRANVASIRDDAWRGNRGRHHRWRDHRLPRPPRLPPSAAPGHRLRAQRDWRRRLRAQHGRRPAPVRRGRRIPPRRDARWRTAPWPIRRQLPFPAEPAGVLMISDDEVRLSRQLPWLSRFPSCAQSSSSRGRTERWSPRWRRTLGRSGWRPAIRFHHTRRPRRWPSGHGRGARVEVGAAAVPPWSADARAGSSGGRARVAADACSIAAGPWSAYLVDPSGAWQPIVATWGATAVLGWPTPAPHRRGGASRERQPAGRRDRPRRGRRA